VLTLGTLPILAKDRLRVKRTRFEWGLIGWLGLSDAMNVLLFFAAYQRTSVAVAVLTHYLTPIFVALAAPLLLRETARARTYVAVAVAFGGLVLLLEPWRHMGSGIGRSDVTGALLGGGSAVFYAANVLVGKRLVPAFSGSELTVFHGVITTAILVTLVSPSDVAAVSPGALGLVLLGSLGPGLTSGLLFVWGLRRIAASHASVLTLLEPFVAVLVAAAFLGERLGAVPVAGGMLILGGAALVVTGRVSSA
jgi:drug/metabolite transporter (DMT)-like permease